MPPSMAKGIPEEGEEGEEEEEVVEVLEDDEPPPEEEEEAPEVHRRCGLLSDALFEGFDTHVDALIQARKRRQEALAFRSAIEDGGAAGADEPGGGGGTQTQDELDGMGVKLPIDQWQGDTNMRTLQKLLSRVDARGFERCAQCTTAHFTLQISLWRYPTRSAQQLEFHEAFMKAAARVIYKGSWETDRPMVPSFPPYPEPPPPPSLPPPSLPPPSDYGKIWLGPLQLRSVDQERHARFHCTLRIQHTHAPTLDECACAFRSTPRRFGKTFSCATPTPPSPPLARVVHAASLPRVVCSAGLLSFAHALRSRSV